MAWYFESDLLPQLCFLSLTHKGDLLVVLGEVGVGFGALA
jgi:hypothetical protein